MKNQIILLLMILGLAVQCLAQELNLKWGKPTAEELSMTTYEPDSEANAVILCRIANARVDYIKDGFKVLYDVKCRIKVLNDEGKEWANVTVPFSYNGHMYGQCELVTKVKATAFNLENGKTVKTKMDDEMVFYEDLNKRTRLLKFTVPQVKQGTVIEYEYSILSDFIFSFNDWVAQFTIPVRYTHYNLRIPEYFKFNINETGFETLSYKSGTNSRRFMLDGNNVLECMENVSEFTGENLPALKKENFVYNPQAYATKVGIELSEIVIPGILYKNYSTTWDDIEKFLFNDENFGGRLGKNPFKNEMTDAGIYDIADDEEKIIAIYNLLKSRVKWNEKISPKASESPGKILKEGSGNNADINFILINMLNDAGFTAMPVVLRTRDRGLLPVAHPTLDKLTCVVVSVSKDDKTWYLDGSHDEQYLNDLPGVMNVTSARVLRKNQPGEWVDLTKACTSRSNSLITGTLLTDGSLELLRHTKRYGRNASRFRQEFKQAADSAEFVSKLGEAKDGEVTKYQVVGHKGFNKSVDETVAFNMQCGQIGDKYFFKPTIFGLFSEPPFTSHDRKMPVEFPSIESRNITVNITLPEGYEVDECPKPVNIKTPDGTMSFVLMTKVDGQNIVTNCKFNIGKTLFTPQEYPQLKAFFDEVIKQVEEVIVIKKQQ